MSQLSRPSTLEPMRKSSSFYRTLDEDRDHIRLLSILPVPDQEIQSVIHCEIAQVSLSDLTLPYRHFVSSQKTKRSARKLLSDWVKLTANNPRQDNAIDESSPDPSLYRYTWGDYETLSYTWGDPTDTRGIVINGEDFSRHGKSRSSPALTARKASFREQISAVGKMRDIYAMSFAAVGWLGEERDGSAQALDLLDKLASFHDPVNDFRARQLAEKLQANPSYLGAGHWLALCYFFERPYWTRLWVIQEIAMSASDMIMHCGEKSLSWERLCLGMGIVHLYLWQVKDSCLAHDRKVAGMDGPWRWPVRQLNKIWKDLYPISQLEMNGKQYLDIKRLLEVASVSECSDPRDRVFGLLPLMDEKLAARILPNYTATTESIFVSVTKAYIEEYQNFEILRSGGLWGSLDLPSWVPDWTWSGRVRDNTARGYDASHGMSMEVSFSSKERCRLTCKGVKVDTIDGIGAAHIPYQGWPRESISQPTSVQTAYGSLDGTKDAIACALYGGRASHGQTDRSLGRALLWLPRDQRKAMDLFKKRKWKNFSQEIWTSTTWGEWRDAHADLLFAEQRFDHYFEDTEPTTDDDTDCYDAYMSWVRTHHGRRLITTERGYVGWVPDKRDIDSAGQVTKGDLIAVVFGCSTPLVLRSQGDAYRVIGEAYLQGFMEGELSAQLAEDIQSPETLVLC